MYTRQVDGNILLEQTRNVGGWYAETSLVKLTAEGISEKIHNQASKKKCNYIVLPKTSIEKEDPLTNYGYEILKENVKYIVYKFDEKVGM